VVYGVVLLKVDDDRKGENAVAATGSQDVELLSLCSMRGSGSAVLSRKNELRYVS